MSVDVRASNKLRVAPVRERGLKSFRCYWTIWNEWVAPVRERGLKLTFWTSIGRLLPVAPVRERGLKY